MNKVEIIDQQEGFIIVNKPADIGFHQEKEQLGFFQLVKNQLAVEELFPVHRLDKMTSGLLILALKKDIAQQFQQLFEQKNVEKYYLAISDKKPLKKQGLIKGDMEKSRRGMWKLTRKMHNPAITQFYSYSITQGKRLFIAKPHTGKTHQIRVALASLGSAILGDGYYSKSNADRGYLHAYALRFTLNNQHFNYQLPPEYGDEFTSERVKELINNIQHPWLIEWPKIK